MNFILKIFFIISIFYNAYNLKKYLVFFDLYRSDLSLLCHCHEGPVVCILDLLLRQHRSDQRIEDQQEQHDSNIECYYRLPRPVYFIHCYCLSFFYYLSKHARPRALRSVFYTFV